MAISRRQWLSYGASCLGGGFGAPLLAQTAPGPRRVVWGQSVPLTGPASEIGLAFAGGAKLYVDAFNDANPGARIDLRQVDDGADPARAAANAQKLLADGADLLFGFVGTASSNAGAAVAQQRGALFFAPFGAADTLRSAANPHVFHVRPSMADEAFKMVRHCTTIGQSRIAVLAEDNPLGHAGLQAVNDAIAELKLPPLVGSAFVPAGSTTVDAAVASLSKLQPQVVIQAALFQTTAAVIQEMRKAGYVGLFMNYSVVGLNPLFLALGKDIRGVVISQVVPSPRSTSVAVVREYNAAIDTSDQTATYESLEGFIAAKALAEGIRRTGRTFTAAALQRTLSGMTAYDVGGFRINLRAGARDAAWGIELVTVTADGRVVR
ncbi:ABC transporter substrate-binding protein [Variovorax arabinosiphilus]|uniref:ABC transporter substrate-binding protein n=1 Tax=Variovorax arabinosiphilus TaxID=3053498 RepID=UPI002578CA13|nr:MULTISPECIES: ABC transporter substrate-binding protein [unclassified Variovorax]MDM0118735.1 ABC transporter substrate-binding protein [Variovorax sp. J2L1-78]MDM0129160.1 ABC transporter substrate-binding protein [Variovorax sp. J2L1-63]MDM0233053.1 ABC transporter substrate-binding protein [Variovorax sp. J2R1-6]